MNITFKQLPSTIKEVVDASSNARSALDRNANGTEATPRSWFFENLDPEVVLDTIVSELNDMQDLDSIKNYDLSKLDKFGPQGEAAPLDQRLDGFEEYFTHLDAPQIISDPIWKQAKLEAIRRLKLNESGSPVSAKAVTDRGIAESKYDTSSGYPLFTKRKNPEAIEHAIKHYKDSIDEKYPCTLGQRASMGKTGVKARNIFMASMDVNVAGQRYQQPLQDYIRSLGIDFFLPWEGWDKVQARISQTWSDHPDALKVGADYTGMDQHFNLYHGLEGFDVVKHFFKPKYWPELRKIITYVFKMPILTGLGYVDQVHAMPSGSEWTNFLETVWNYIFSIYMEIKYHFKFLLRMGIGDDQSWFLDGKWNASGVRWMTETIVKEFDYAGLPGNPDKQEVSTYEMTFLQRFSCNDWNGYDGKTRAAGVYSMVRNVTSQMYPEFMLHIKPDQPQWHELFPIRAIQIAENLQYHPLFKWYMQEIVAKSNPNILEFVRQEDSKINQLYESAKKVQHLVPSYVGAYGEEKPLTEFAAFKELRAIA